jgi:hypothetical protein
VRRGLLALALVAVVGGLLAVSGAARTSRDGTPAEAAFRLADGSAGCAYADGRVACRTATMAAAAVLEGDGSTLLDGVPVAWDEQTTVLRSTESWWHGDFSCRLAEGNLVCTSLSGGMIAVGKGRLSGSPPASFATLP